MKKAIFLCLLALINISMFAGSYSELNAYVSEKDDAANYTSGWTPIWDYENNGEYYVEVDIYQSGQNTGSYIWVNIEDEEYRADDIANNGHPELLTTGYLPFGSFTQYQWSYHLEKDAIAWADIYIKD